MISKESLEKFKQLYKKEFGEEISDQVALDKATKLLNLYRAVYLPVTETDNNHDKDNKSR